MAETTTNEQAQNGADLAAAVRDRGIEQIEGAKGQLAEGAERVASAVERTAGELEEDGDSAISGFGRSVASLMRQLAGGLRERDVEDFARELADMARRNPGVFLAGSVALGFGIARFFKAGTSRSSDMRGGSGRQSADTWQSSRAPAYGARGYDADEDDAEERLDLSENSARSDATPTDDSRNSSASGNSQRSQDNRAARDSDQERNASKSRQAGKQRVKPQRASSGDAQPPSPSSDRPPTDAASTAGTTGSDDSAFTGGTDGGAVRGGKS
jgi:hypothetical protein